MKWVSCVMFGFGLHITNAISAVCQDSVLTVTMQKLPLEPKKPKTIEVKIG